MDETAHFFGLLGQADFRTTIKNRCEKWGRACSEIVGRFAQTVESNPLCVAIGIKETDHSLGLLKRPLRSLGLRSFETEAHGLFSGLRSRYRFQLKSQAGFGGRANRVGKGSAGIANRPSLVRSWFILDPSSTVSADFF